MERRKCPDGHVYYEINPYTFSSTTLNEDKHYCPVCGKPLISYGKDEYALDWTKKESQSYTIKPSDING